MLVNIETNIVTFVAQAGPTAGLLGTTVGPPWTFLALGHSTTAKRLSSFAGGWGILIYVQI